MVPVSVLYYLLISKVWLDPLLEDIFVPEVSSDRMHGF
jgi:hypothetical protein